jgi:hypothetical protein
MRPDLAITMHPEHPCREEERSMTSSRPATFDLAGRRASPGLAARLGRGAKMSRLRFYNQRFTSRALDIDITSGDCAPVAVSKPTAPGCQIDPRAGEVLPPFHPGLDAGPPRGHPSSSGCMLEGTPAGFGSIDCRGRFRALRESSGAFSAHRMPCRPTSSGTSSDGRSWSR